MNLKFKSEEDKNIKVGFPIVFMLMAAWLLFMFTKTRVPDRVMEFIFSVLFLSMFLWVRFGTYYVITDEWLRIYMGPRLRKIRISEMNFIRLNQKPAGSTRGKASLSYRGIVIYYRDKRRSFYLSPVNSNDFIEALKKINPAIEIREGLIK